MGFDNNLSQEQKIMFMMRKVLAQVVKDTTPTAPGIRHPLRDDTIQFIRECFAVIVEREKLLQEGQGQENVKRPRYKDGLEQSTIVPLKDVKKKPV